MRRPFIERLRQGIIGKFFNLPIINDLYNQNDALTIGSNETGTVGSDWSTADGSLQVDVVESDISDYALKLTLLSADYDRMTYQLNNMEVGALYRITCDTKGFQADEVSLGGGFFRAAIQLGWDRNSSIDIMSTEWLNQSFEAIAILPNPTLEIYPSWLNDEPLAGGFTLIDNMKIEKIPDSPIDPEDPEDPENPENPEETTMTFVDYNPPTPLPEYLVPFIEENFGNKVTRISSIADFGGDNRYLVHNYSKRQVWNSDQTLLNLGDGRLLDGNTYELLGSYETGNMGWSNTNPYRSYGTTTSTNYFRTYSINPETFALTTVSTRNFSAYNVMSHWTAETNISADDKYVVLYGHRVSTGTDTWVLVYNREDDEIVSETNLGTPRSNVNWVSMSQSGNFVVVLYNSDGSGTHQGTKAYNRNMVLQKHLTNTTQHGDLGYDQNGNEVWVFYDLGYLKSTTLLGSGGIIQYAYMQGGHVSCRNLNRPGWVYISDNGDANIPSDYPAFREVFAVKLDEKPLGVVTVNRFTKHYTKTNSNYEHYAMACASPDGTKIIFKSNMTNATVESQTYPFAWVVEVDVATPINKYNAFKNRVIVDNGIFIENPITFGSEKLLLTPNAYKENKLYSALPSNGSGDFTFSRNSSASYIEDGIIKTALPNVPRIQDGKILIEGQATNLIHNSEPSVNEGTNANVTYTTLNYLGEEYSAAYFDGDISGNKYRYTNSGTNPNTLVTFSFLIEMDDKEEPIVGRNNSGDLSVVIRGSVVEMEETQKIDLGNGIWKIIATTDQGSVNNVSGVVKYTGQSLRNFKVTWLQFELGGKATSYIPTSGGSATRLADIATVTTPSGTTEIIETIDGVEQSPITVIPPTYQLPEGNIDNVKMI